MVGIFGTVVYRKGTYGTFLIGQSAPYFDTPEPKSMQHTENWNSIQIRISLNARNKYMDAAAELGRNPLSKHQIQPEYGHEQADAGDGTA